RAAGNLEKTPHLSIRPSTATFSNVRAHRRSRAAHLTCQSIQLFFWKATSRLIDLQSKFMSLCPHSQIFEVFHQHPSFKARSQKLGAQKLFTKFFPGNCFTFPASSSSNSAAKISDDDMAGSSRSTISSMCVDSSARRSDRIFFSCGDSSLSPNRDAVSVVSDSPPTSGCSVSRTSVGSSSQTSSHVATSLAPCLMSVLGVHEPLLVTFPGTAKTSRFCSKAQRAVIR